jgi:hypothetical protein
MTLKEIQLRFNQIEKNNIEIFNHKINNVYFWKLVRFIIHLEVVRYHSNKSSSILKKQRNNFFKKISYVLLDDIKILIYKQRKFEKDSENIVFNSGRFVLYEKKYIDPITHFIKEKLSITKNIITFDPHIIHDQKKYAIKPNYAIPLRSLRKIKERFIRLRIDDMSKDILTKIEKDFELELGLKINLSKLIYNAVRNFIVLKRYYKRIIRKIEAKNLYLVCSYGMEPLISACNDLKINVIELQHGVLNNYHMGYSFPTKSVKYFPDEILFFGDWWHNYTNIPLTKSKRIIWGYEYLNRQKELYSNLKKTSSSILILTQGDNTIDIITFLKNFILTNKKYKISIKFHPSEYLGWEKKYPEILKLESQSFIRIINNLNENLHYTLAKTEKVIGVSSTSIYEALAFNCECFILDLSGWEYLENLIEQKLIIKIDNENEVKNKIRIKLQNDFNIKHYFA